MTDSTATVQANAAFSPSADEVAYVVADAAPKIIARLPMGGRPMLMLPS